MFPWYMLFRASPRPTATAAGWAMRNAKCEACNCEYVYQVFRRVWGGSQQEAVENLHNALYSACDPVPCPECGWYQRDMVERARQLRCRLLEYAGAGLVLVSVVAFLIVVSVGVRAGSSVWWCVLPLALFASGVVLLVLRSVLPRSFDPNTADLESRIRLGRRRAISKEAYEAGEFPTAAKPGTPDRNPLDVDSNSTVTVLLYPSGWPRRGGNWPVRANQW